MGMKRWEKGLTRVDRLLPLPDPPRGGGKEDPMTKLKIEGMTCNHCVMAVKQALLAVPGVTGKVEVSLEKKQATVEGSAVAQALIAAVVEEGYTASVLA